MKHISKICTYGILVIFSIISLFPPVWIALTSIKPPVEMFTMPPCWVFTPTLQGYEQVLLNSEFPRFLLNSVIIVTSTVLLTLLIGSLAGYALARFRIKYKENFFFFVLTSRMGPAVVFGIPFFLLWLGLGLIDSYVGMILVYIFFNLAFCIWMMRGFFEEVPAELEEAALVDGFSRFEAFRKITLPLVAPGLIATATFIFILTWNEFFYSMILTNYAAKTFTVQLPAFFGARRIIWENVTAASTIGMLPPLLFAILIRKYIIRGLTFGMVKK